MTWKEEEPPWPWPLNQKWYQYGKIGSGSYGIVWGCYELTNKGLNTKSMKPYAMKITDLSPVQDTGKPLTESEVEEAIQKAEEDWLKEIRLTCN